MFLTDAGASKVISISLWETESARAASENSGYLQEQLRKVGAILAGQPTIDHYEISVQG